MADDDSETAEPHSDIAYEVAIALIYTIAVSVNVYLIVDQLTDGALSTSMSMKLTRLRARMKHWYSHNQTVRKDIGKVLWQATNIVEGTDQ